VIIAPSKSLKLLVLSKTTGKNTDEYKEIIPGVRLKTLTYGEKTMMSDRALQLAADTGASVYWQSAAEVAAQIEKDMATMAGIEAMLAE
jgi:hypothetical protein